MCHLFPFSLPACTAAVLPITQQVVVSVVMAAAVLPSTRGLATVRTSKSLVLIFSLLCLLHVASSQLGIGLEQIHQGLRTMTEELNKQKAEDEHRTATLSKLLDLAGSLDTKEQLKTFRENLQRAAQYSRLQKELNMIGMLTDSDQINQQMNDLFLKMEMLTHYPSLQELSDILVPLVEKLQNWLSRKEEIAHAETVTELEEI
ncbi:uncharacterized protein LOC125009257 [Mugil cephalus]|uniref:uncharacterized protein LOC125009257 n=1 Tax=Mugil cephalus TaxID=48193 RepID=UPI001FB7C893|nr:uncharacterized protein LOC125009257 [Mugil cephalus]